MKNSFEHWIATATWHQFQKEKTTAHRIFSSSQGWIERWNEEALISCQTLACRDEILQQLAPWAKQIGFPYQRIWQRKITHTLSEQSSPQLIFGTQPSNPLAIVQERGVNFQIDFNAGYSLGLFLDQRHNRDFVRRQKPKKLLNCFAYTGSFSVMAALGGSETLSIDLSKKSLERAKENFRLNQLDPSHHRFWAEDVRDSLRKLQRRQETFDMIVLDPPTFSRGKKGKTFQVEHDLKLLLQAALPLLSSPGKILISTNCSRITKFDLIQLCQATLIDRPFQLHEEPPLLDIPESRAAQTLWLLIN